MDFKKTEKKWQQTWDEKESFKAVDNSQKPKYYALDMFPYPSGVGLHIGHIASYTPTDIISRYKRAQGFNVLHPIGYDAFGLPAENYAKKTGVHPAVTTQKAIETFRRQLKAFGFSYDWSREISTCEPTYYKWTQLIFLKLFEKGLAYKKDTLVNWCPELQTVLANEEIVNGKSERGGHPIVRVPMLQWVLDITAYAERLLADLDKVDWPEKTKEGQRNWIGKSVGHLLNFKVNEENIAVFTTRLDTLYGVSFLTLAPEHPLVGKITTPAQKAEVEAYQQVTAAQLEVDRKGAEISGAFTGAYAVHPLTQQLIPIWIGNYVLGGYGQGAIMGVPAHDERDFNFAQKFRLPIIQVIQGSTLPVTGSGNLMNSPLVEGLSVNEATKVLEKHVLANQIGKPHVEYKLRDWIFSRQKYWGEPFPIIHYPEQGMKGVSPNELPVLLPAVVDYTPSKDGKKSPLSKDLDWVNHDGGQRETDTMPGSAGSSWYFLRFTDPHNDQAPFDFTKQHYWMPVDLYVGGPEHTVGHLLYARFWQKVLFDAGMVSHDEPFKKLAHQGMILGTDGLKISKSSGNMVDLDKIYNEYGADMLRTYISFLGPLDQDKPWSDKNITGVKRFFNRIEKMVMNETGTSIVTDEPLSADLHKKLHKTIKQVGENIEDLRFNTAIAHLMELVNKIDEAKTNSKIVLQPLVQMLAPFAPHFCEELWEKMGATQLLVETSWPTYDSLVVVDDVVSIGVQVNGKVRGSIALSPQASEETAKELALNEINIQAHIGSQKVEKVIYRPGKILNLIVK